MSEIGVLFLVAAYPHRVALARRVRDNSIFPVLRRLEAQGLLWRKQDQYRLTRCGRDELAMTRALIGLDP
jgi:DNA-binding PadR family transcriptional regulator